MLSDNSLVSLDGNNYFQQEQDVSVAKCPNGTGLYYYNRLPTWGSDNFCITGLEEHNSDNDFSISPIPASDRISIGDRSGVPVNLHIFDLLGRAVYSVRFSENVSIETYNWSAGVYIASNGRQSKKFIISQ